MAEVGVSTFESGANLKLISKNLRPLFKSVPDSVFVCVGDTIDTEEPDYLKWVAALACLLLPQLVQLQPAE